MRCNMTAKTKVWVGTRVYDSNGELDHHVNIGNLIINTKDRDSYLNAQLNIVNESDRFYLNKGIDGFHGQINYIIDSETNLKTIKIIFDYIEEGEA